MYTYNTLTCGIEEGIATVTINRPESLNALNSQVFKELGAVFEEMGNDNNVRVVIITGAGKKAFVAGADIMELRECSVIEGRAVGLLANRTQKRIEDFPKPVIAAINGFALGGGLELAMTCDIRIASDNARFGQPEINLALIPGAGGTQRLPRLIGVTKAKELIYLGDMIDAATALNLGLVNKVVPPEKLMEEAMAWAKQLASKSGPVLAMAKMAINTGVDTDIASGLNMETKCNALCFATEDQKEGMDAFLARPRRNAVFKNK